RSPSHSLTSLRPVFGMWPGVSFSASLLQPGGGSFHFAKPLLHQFRDQQIESAGAHRSDQPCHQGRLASLSPSHPDRERKSTPAPCPAGPEYSNHPFGEDPHP